MTFSNPVVGGTTLIRPAIQSPNFIQGSAGWSINKDGSAEFNNVTVRGTGTSSAVVVGSSTGPQVLVGSNATAGFIKFPTNRPIESQISSILAGVLNQGAANESASLQITGPAVSGATNSCHLFLNSQNNDGSSNANAALVAGSGTLTLDQTSATLQGSRLFVSPSASTLNALSVQTTAGHTGNTFRLAKDATVFQTVDTNGVLSHFADVNVTGNLAVTGSLTAGNIQKGVASITTVANQWVEVAVTFPTAFSATPVVTVSGNNNAPAVGGTTTLYDAVTAVTTSGFTLRVFRGTAITMNYGWIAIA